MAPSATATQANTRSLAAPLATVCALGAATLYTYVRNPFHAGAFPPCFLHAATGLSCPGCGGLRAVHALLHGQLAEAATLNSLVVFGVIPAALVALTWWLGAAAGREWPAPRIHRSVWWILAGVVVAFTVLRNFGPLAPYLAP